MDNGKKDTGSHLPPEYTAPPEFGALPDEFGRVSGREAFPPEHGTGQELSPPAGEFFGTGEQTIQGNVRGRRRKGLYLVAAFLMLVVTVAAALGSGGPENGTPIEQPGLPAEPADPSKPEEEGPADLPGTDCGESGLYMAYIGGSYCMLKAELTEPETIRTARLSVIDTVSGLPFRPEQFGEEIPPEELAGGRYTVDFIWVPDDMFAYWDQYGENTMPVLEISMTVERTDGSSETLEAQYCGSGPGGVYRLYDRENGTVELTLMDREAWTVVLNAPEEAEERTAYLRVTADGEALPGECCSVTYDTEEQEWYTDSGETGTAVSYFAKVLVTLPQTVTEDTRLLAVLELPVGGYEFTYTVKIS